MTSENAAPAEMPGEIEVANALIAHFVEHTGFTTVEGDETKTRVSAYYGGVWVELRVYPMARAILALFAPILAEKDGYKEIVRKAAEARDAAGYIGAVWDCIDDLSARALAAEAALAAERERCAKIAEAHDGLPCRSLLEGQRGEDYDSGQIDASTSIAAAIRAQGE